MAPTREQVRWLAADINRRLDLSATSAITADTLSLYCSLTPTTLRILRHAFLADRDYQPPRPRHTIAFCQSRIDLIDRLLGDGRVATERESSR